MIGFQCASSAPPAPTASKQSAAAQQQTEAPSSGSSSPGSRRSSASSSSCSAASSPRGELANRLAAGHLHHQQLPSIQQHVSQTTTTTTTSSATKAHSELDELRAGSPGYHSAAPSPGGSTSGSSVASPISSSASTSSTSVCSSSGISTASLLSAVSSVGLLQQHHQQMQTLHQHQPITTTASSTHRAAQQQQQHQVQLPSSSSSNEIAPLAAGHQLAYLQQQQQQTNSYASLIRTQQQQQQQKQHQHQQRQSNSSQNGLGPLLDHFPEARREALSLSWFHEANNRATLNAALASTKLMVAGDISLAEMSRYPVPIMARPPLGVSDLTLENWITEVLRARKGIKLTFTSTRTVEPAFRVLARHADQLRGPLLLSADVLARPQAAAGNSAQAARGQPANKQQQQPVDAWTFLMLCRTRFPKSIISIGWCGGGAGAAAAESAPIVDSPMGQPAESMFELDLLEQQHHQFSSPILHLSQQARVQHSPLANFRQQQASAAGLLCNRQLLQAGRPAPFGQSGCASSGSLNSSSGNSSGSPSPTSPVGSALSLVGAPAKPAGHRMRHSTSGAPSTSLQGGWPAVAAAAVVAQLQQQQQEQLPLNLNINEAEPQHASHVTTSLQELAHTIQQLQQQSSSLESLSSSLHQSHGQESSSEATAAALALASNILQASATSPHTGHAHQLLISQLREAQKWEHVSKKAAVSNRLNTNSPSPISTSPKQQPAPASPINLLSCVAGPASKPLGHLSNHLHLHRHQHHHQQQHMRIPQQQQRRPEVAGYTREMIDKMCDLVKHYNLTQAITFPVEARWLVRRHSAHFAHSLSELQRLLFQVGPNSSLTLVAHAQDLISAEELQLIRKHFAPNQILYDLPSELVQALKQHEQHHSSTSANG